jgi:hypothetical protein
MGLFETIGKMFEHSYNWFVLSVCIAIGVILKIKKNKAIINYLPAFCSSIGILTTFFILYKSLNNITSETDVNSVIRELSNKFSASLIGVFFSIVYSILIRSRFYEASNLQPWEELDSKKVLYELWEVHQLTNKYLDQFMHQLNREAAYFRFGLDYLNISILKLIDAQEKLETFLNSSAASLSDSLSKFVNSSLIKLTEDSNRIMTQLIDENGKHFTSAVVDSIEKQRENANEALLQLQSTFQDLGNAITELSTEMKQKLAENIDHSSEQTEAITSGFNEARNGLMKTYEEQATKLEPVFSEFSQSLQNFNSQILGTGELMAKNGAERIEQILLQFQEVEHRHLTALETVTNRFSHAVEQYESVVEDHQKILSGMTEQNHAIIQLDHTNNELVRALKANVELIQRMNEEIASLFNTVGYLQDLKHAIPLEKRN